MEKLIQIVKKNLRHQDYERVVHLADTYKKLFTGEDMDSLMRRFSRRESAEAFTQRKLITQHITKSVFQNLIKPAYKVPRSNGVRRILMYTDDTENEKQKTLEGILDKFHGNESMDGYMQYQSILLNHVDPNAFVVVEWADFNSDTEHAQPYPFEVSAKEAVYFEYFNNVLQTLVVRQEYIKDPILDAEETVIYTKYDKNGSKKFTKVNDAKELRMKIVKPDVITKYQGKNYVRIDNDVYLVEEFTNSLGFVPAIRMGFKRDVYTNGRTMVSAIDESMPILMKLVKANSELDLTMALHTFPQKVQYAPRCVNDKCNSGSLSDGKICPDCKGEGWSESASAQEIITLEMPKDKEEIIDLGNIIHYESPPVDLIKFQDEYIRTLSARAKDARYNSDIFSKSEVQETATGKNIDLQNVYDSLWGDAMFYRFCWNFFVSTSAKITDLNKNLVHDYIFSRDFKMKSLNDLYLDLKLISDSKADEFVKTNIQSDIAQIIYFENPLGLQKYKTQQIFFPYAGKTKEEILFIVSTTPLDDPHRVLWESYGWIFDEIALEQGKDGKNFYEFKLSRQKKLIDKKVKEIIKNQPKGLSLEDVKREEGTEES